MDQNTLPSAPQITDEVAAQAKGFIGSLMDFSFESFVTPKIIKLVYFLMLIMAAFASLSFLMASMASRSSIGILIGLIGAPVVFLLCAAGARVYVELVMVIFKILETLKKIESK